MAMSQNGGCDASLGGWVAFKPMQSEVMVMGDLMLLETGINPVMAPTPI
jgi:Domain of Unknown Function (DUF1259)